MAGSLLLSLPGCGDTGGGGSPTKPDEQTITCADIAGPSAPVPVSLWTQLSPTGTAPSGRWRHGGAYDVRNDRLIVYGGTGASGTLGDAWVLANASGRGGTPAWTALTATGTAPPARAGAVVAYDSIRNRLIVFGGADTAGYILGDLWLLSNANGIGGSAAWTRMPVTPTPELIARRAAAYDARADRITLWGGLACGATSCTLYNTLASLRNLSGTISYFADGASGPGGRSDPTGAYDALNGRLLLIGGNASTAKPQSWSGVTSESWALLNANGSGAASWRALPAIPGGRAYHDAVYDTQDGRVVVYAGVGGDGYVRDDVWLLDGAAALQSMQWLSYADASSPAPKARAGALAAYVPAANLLLVFGGTSGGNNYENDVWVLRLTAPRVASVAVLSNATEVCTGYYLQLTGVARDSAGNAVDAPVTWSSSNPAVLDVDASGLVTSKAAGSASVTASSGTVRSTPLALKVNAAVRPGGGSSTGLSIVAGQSVGGCVDTYGDRTSNIGAVTLMARGGAPLSGYTWTVTSGYAFPAGTTVLPETGIFKASGGKIAAGQFSLRVTVSDGSSTASGSIPVVIETASSAPQDGVPMPGCPAGVFQQATVSQIDLAEAKAGSAYGASLYAMVGSGQDGGTLPLTWSVGGGSLPGGLALDAARGIVRGTPFSSAAGQTYSFQVRVKDAAGKTAICGNGGLCPTYRIKVN